MSNLILKMSKIKTEEPLRRGGELEEDDRRWQINVEMDGMKDKDW